MYGFFTLIIIEGHDAKLRFFCPKQFKTEIRKHANV